LYTTVSNTNSTSSIAMKNTTKVVFTLEGG
jgi:hypothetical protein